MARQTLVGICVVKMFRSLGGSFDIDDRGAPCAVLDGKRLRLQRPTDLSQALDFFGSKMPTAEAYAVVRALRRAAFNELSARIRQSGWIIP